MTRLDACERLIAALLAAIAGFVDGSAFLASKGFFVSFMSGNSTRLGAGLVGRHDAAAAAGGLILAFVAGVAIMTRLRRAGLSRRLTLAAVALLLGAAAILARHDQLIAAIGCMAAAMGMTNTVLAGEDGVRVGLTYMTGALVRIGEAIGGGAARSALPHLMLWLSLVGGCATGAALFAVAGLDDLWLPATLLTAMSVAPAGAIRRSLQP